MKNHISWLNGYSVIFSIVIFAILLGQLFVSGITINSISEQYLWRRELIQKFNSFKYIIGDRVFEIAVVGKEGWFFFTGDTSIQDYQKTSPMKVGNLKRLLHELSRLKEKTDQYGGIFLLVIPTNKSTIYPEFMPNEIPIIGQASSLDRLVEYMKKKSNIQVLDLRPVLELASEASQVYYKTDTHWNCIGAFYAYQEILSSLAVSYPQLSAYSLSDFEMVSSQNSLRDIPSLLGLNVVEDTLDVLPRFDIEILNAPVPNYGLASASLQNVVSSRKDLPELMIFHDSFYSVCLDRFMEPAFSRTISMPYADGKMIDYLDLISTEKPDVVIVEFVERYMGYFLWQITE